jgi:hypothetical protein
MSFVCNQNYNLFLWKDQWLKRPYYCIYYLLFTFTRNKITELSSRRKTEEKEEETPDRKLSGVGMKKQRKEENTKLKNNGKKTKYRTKRRSRNGETMKRKKTPN